MIMIKNRGVLSRDPRHERLIQLAEYALQVADPYKAVASSIELNGRTLIVKDGRVELGKRVHVVGFGKASVKMAEAVYSILGELISGGVVIHPGEPGRVGPIEVLKGDHPFPGHNTLKSSVKLLEYLKTISEDDTLIVLISGGGSALFEIPEEGVSLEDISIVSRELMKKGATIHELNTVRKRLSRVKGGKLLKHVKASKIVSLIVSDVVGDDLSIIASGPTAPDPTSFEDAYRVLARKGLLEVIPASIKELFEKGLKGLIEDTLKPDHPAFKKVENYLVLSNQIVLQKLCEALENMGYRTLLLTSMLEGEAREVGKVLASIIKNILIYGTPIGRPAAILAGGETVVTVKGKGVGGRNQELCLSLSISLRGVLGVTAACLATDGIDGVSPAAGAIVDGDTVDEALRKGLDPWESLDNNDSYGFFSRINRAIITEYTGTNVNDIFLALVE
ncbi:MAG: glycerate kinase [Desulfurococcaceae archaeon]